MQEWVKERFVSILISNCKFSLNHIIYFQIWSIMVVRKATELLQKKRFNQQCVSEVTKKNVNIYGIKSFVTRACDKVANVRIP